MRRGLRLARPGGRLQRNWGGARPIARSLAGPVDVAGVYVILARRLSDAGLTFAVRGIAPTVQFTNQPIENVWMMP